MQDGNFTFYVLQHRKTHESPWLEPEGELQPVEERSWVNSSWDYFGGTAEPWEKPEHGPWDWEPKYKESHAEIRDVMDKTGRHGWWSHKYALCGLARVRKGDEEGKFDSRDGYNKLRQAVRHEFRLAKITVSKKTEIVGIRAAEKLKKILIDEKSYTGSCDSYVCSTYFYPSLNVVVFVKKYESGSVHCNFTGTTKEKTKLINEDLGIGKNAS